MKKARWILAIIFISVLLMVFDAGAEGTQLALWLMDDLYFTQVPGGDYSHAGTLNFDIIGISNRNVKAPFDGEIVATFPTYESGNTVVLQSVNKVKYANGTVDYMSIAVAHDNDISDCEVGRRVTQGEVFCQNGDYGNVTGVHSHVTVIAGKYTDHPGFIQVPTGNWTFSNAITPESALFITNSTNIVNAEGISFALSKNTVVFEPNGGKGSSLVIEKDNSESFILSTTTANFTKKDYYLDHWSTTPDDTGTRYYFGNDLRGLNSTLYAIWYEAIPPELTGDVYASNISYNSFTLTVPVSDNVGVAYISAQVAPYLVPSNKKTVLGTYNNTTKVATITVSLDKLKFRSDLYNVKLIVRDAAGNTLNHTLEPLSTYIIDTTDKGIWKSIDSDTPVYAAPVSSGTYNGVSQIQRCVEAGEKFDMLGSMQADGTDWLRIGAINEFVKKSDFKYDTLSNLWKNIVSQFVFVLEGQSVYASEGPAGRVKLSGTSSTSIGSPSIGSTPIESGSEGSNTETNGIIINDINFPDLKFRSYISTSFDIDKDGKLSYTELYSVHEINLVGTYYVHNLTGIEYFTNLEVLNCSNQSITALDLSSNPALINLNCSGNTISELNISTNHALQKLECDSVGLQVLNLTENEALEYVSCAKQGAFSLILGRCPVLKELYCYGNGLSSLDLSGCVALNILDCSTNNLTTIDLSPCVSLRRLYCASNNFSSLTLNNSSLVCIDCMNCHSLTSLDVSSCPQLVELWCRFCALPNVDVSNNSELNEFWCCGNNLSELDISKNAKLGHLYCVENQLETLDVSHNPELWGLSCGLNKLTELDLSHNPLLRDLSCYGNQLTYLDLSNNPELTELRTYKNRLTSLDLTNNTKLEYVWAEDNVLEIGSKIDLETLPGFDINKMTNLTGGVIVDHTLILTETTAQYDYLCNSKYKIIFSVTGEPDEANFSSTTTPAVIPTPTPSPEALDFEITVPETLEIGNPLTVIISNVKARSLQVGVYDENGSHCGGATSYKDSKVVLDEGIFESAGTYTLQITVYTTNNWGRQTRNITVTGTRASAPAVTAVSDEIDKDSEVEFVIVKKGLTEIRYKRKEITRSIYYRYNASSAEISGNVATWSETLAYDDAYVEYCFSAKVGGIWTQYSDPVVIHCKAIGKLDIPSIQGTTTFQAGVPISIYVDEVEHATQYSLSMYGGSSSSINKSLTTYGETLIAPYGLNGGTYTLQILVRGTAYEQNRIEIPIIVEGECPVPIVTVPEGTFYEGETVNAVVSAANLDCIAILNYREDSIIYGNGEFISYPIKLKSYWNETKMRAKIGGLWSDEIKFRVMGEVKEVDYEDPVISSGTNFKLGEIVPVTIKNVRDDVTYTYNVTWNDGEEPRNIVYENELKPEDGIFIIPAYSFAFPGSYTITINVYTDDGIYSYLGEASVEINILDNNELPEAPVVKLLSNIIYEQVYFGVETRGADKLYVYEKRVKEPNDEGDPIIINLDPSENYYRYDTYIPVEVEFHFKLEINGLLSKTSEPIRAVPSESMDPNPLGKVVLHVPEVLEYGKDLVVSWDSLPGAEDYYIKVGNYQRLFNASTLSCVVPAEYITPSNGYIWIWFTANALNRGISADYIEIEVVDMSVCPSLRLAGWKDGGLKLVASGIYADRAQLRINGDDAGYVLRRSDSENVEFVLSTAGYTNMKIEIRNCSSDREIISAWSPTLEIDLNNSSVLISPDFILPADLTTIETSAFEGNSFMYAVVPASVNRIPAMAFANCPYLTYIRIEGDDTMIDKDAFSGVTNLTIIASEGSYAEFYANKYGHKFINFK